MAKKEFRVRRVTRFVVTRFVKSGKSHNSQALGTFDQEGAAMLAAQSMAKYEGGIFDAAPAVANRHKVAQSQWEKWGPKGQETFNWLFELMYRQPDLFMHPKAEKQPDEHRKTTAWNAAWLAADAVRDVLKAA